MKNTLLSLLTISTSLVATEEGRMRNLENRVTALEDSQCCPYLLNPCARAYPPECFGFYVGIDPLIWKANVGGVGVATQTNDGQTFFFSGKSRVKNPSFNWDFGFRLTGGLNTNHDAWEVQLVWTRWNTDAKRNLTAGDSEANFPVWGIPSALDGSNSPTVFSKWKMHLNLLDLENGKDFYISKCITLKPFAGLRTAWINQEFDIDYRNLDNQGSEYDVRQRDRFWGIGIRGGFNFNWKITPCFGVFSNYAGNLLYAYHSIKHDENPDIDFLKMSDFHHVGAAIYDMQLGLYYDWISCDECYHIGLNLGWELHYYPGQNQFIKLVDDSMLGKFVQNGGDLGIQGFFFAVRFDF